MQTATATPAIDVAVDDLIGVSAAIEKVTGKRPSPPSAWRYATKGVNGVVLPTVKVGRCRYTTMDAVRWWVHSQTAATAYDTDQPAGRTPERERRLQAAGLL